MDGKKVVVCLVLGLAAATASANESTHLAQVKSALESAKRNSFVKSYVKRKRTIELARSGDTKLAIVPGLFGPKVQLTFKGARYDRLIARAASALTISPASIDAAILKKYRETVEAAERAGQHFPE